MKDLTRFKIYCFYDDERKQWRNFSLFQLFYDDELSFEYEDVSRSVPILTDVTIEEILIYTSMFDIELIDKKKWELAIKYNGYALFLNGSEKPVFM